MMLKEMIEAVSEGEKNASAEISVLVVSNVMIEPYMGLHIRNLFSQDGYKVQYQFVKTEISETIASEVLKETDLLVIDIDLETVCGGIMSLEMSTDYRNRISGLLRNYICHLDENLLKGELILFSLSDLNPVFRQITGNVYHCDSVVDEMNQLFSELSVQKHWIFLDKEKIFSEVGSDKIYSPVNHARWGMCYTEPAIEKMAAEVRKQNRILRGKSAKCLILDCDNVLWGGILSEAGMEGIRLGEYGQGVLYKNFQRFLKKLSEFGIILCVCSKNDKEDVLAVFRTHGEMVLRESDISCFVTSWDNKSKGILDIADQLNIGLNSMVFVDDNPAEINEIEFVLPEVSCITFFAEDPFRGFGDVFHLSGNEDHDTAVTRRRTYQTNTLRERQRTNSADYESYLKALDTKIEIMPSQKNELERIASLLMRTNKCTNGTRLSRKDLQRNIENGSFDAYSVYVRDCFSELGLSGAMIVRDKTHLEAFALSCRALGRNLEQEMVAFLLERYKLQTIDFADTGKNEGIRVQLEKMIWDWKTE